MRRAEARDCHVLQGTRKTADHEMCEERSTQSGQQEERSLWAEQELRDIDSHAKICGVLGSHGGWRLGAAVTVH